MLNKVLVGKFVTAMALAGLATGAAAGFDVDDPADDGDPIELEAPLPLDDDESTTSDDETTEDESDDVDDTDADDTEGDDADDDADVADDEGSKPEKAADGSEDGDAVKEPKAPNHGSIVSECARSTELTGRDKGQAVSTVAKDDTAACAAPAETPAPADESDAETEDKADDEPRATKAQGAEHRNDKAGEKLAERDARKAGR